MRYEIHFSKTSGPHTEKVNWTTKSSFCKILTCQENDESKIMSSFIDLCSRFPEVVSRHNVRIFDNYIYDWVVMTRVPEQFEAFSDPICIIWNQHLPEGHPLLRFKQTKSR